MLTRMKVKVELQTILNLAKKYMFFCEFKDNSRILYNYGPSGSLLFENIKSEWMSANVTNRDVSVYLFTQNQCESVERCDNYVRVRNIHNKQLPFGVATITNSGGPAHANSWSGSDVLYQPSFPTSFTSQLYIAPAEAKHYFLHWQRHRKLWWKKLAQSPDRFSLSDIRKQDDGSTSVDVLAAFPWGNQILETISLTQFKHPTSDTDLSARSGRRSVQPMIVENMMSVDSAMMGLFCDGYSEEEQTNKIILRIDKKLAPYKCVFATPDSTLEPSLKEELSMLIFSLTKQLRKSDISTIHLPMDWKTSLSHQVARNDEWGIPFTIITDPSTLRTGILNIRDRDTTLTEDVHVSELVKHMRKLIRK